MSDDKIFAQQTALVTGGARGIGRAVCKILADLGARVAINYEKNESAARETLQLIGCSSEDGIIIQADVSQEDQVGEMIDAIRERLGSVDLLVNNAGIASSTNHDELVFADWKRMFEVNLDGPFLTTWAVKDDMIAKNYGRIVNVSSLAGIKIKKDMIHYATAKAAVISLTRHCAEAFATHNIRVNCVAPGLTNTDLAQSANPALLEQLVSATPMGRMGEPAEIANVVKFLLCDDSSFVTGQTVPVCGGRC